MEEGRCFWLEQVGMPFATMEDRGVTIPVLGVNCEYKHHVTFGDVILIEMFVKEYSGVRLTVGYNITNKETGELVMLAETKHCFTNGDLKPINLKKYEPEFSDKFQLLFDDNK